MYRLAFLIGLWVAAVTLGPAVPAAGYVIPAPFVIQKMLENLDLPEGMRINQDVRIRPDNEAAGVESDNSQWTVPQVVGPAGSAGDRPVPPRVFAQQVRYRLPGAFRSDIEAPELRRIHVYFRGESITVIDGRLITGDPAWHTRYKDLFVFSSPKSLVRHLEALGIDMNTCSLGRMGGNLVYVIGARYPDLQRQQIWVDKDHFRPVRWIVTPASDPQAPPVHEIRYLQWRRFGDTLYPETVAFFENGEETRSLKVRRLEADPAIPAELFDIGALRRRHAKPASEGRSGAGGRGSEIQEEIREFKNLYEY